jgi:serine/threonine protein kinase
MPLTPGSRLGPYEVLSAIGAGGMGEVYRARDPRLGREVAGGESSPAPTRFRIVGAALAAARLSPLPPGEGRGEGRTTALSFPVSPEKAEPNSPIPRRSRHRMRHKIPNGKLLRKRRET